MVEHARPALWVGPADNLPGRLVVNQNPRIDVAKTQSNRATANLHPVSRSHPLTYRRDLPVDRHQTRGDEGLHIATRSQPGLGQRFL